jgi:hypothetical protein
VIIPFYSECPDITETPIRERAAKIAVQNHTGNTVDPRFFTPKGLILPFGPKEILGLI